MCRQKAACLVPRHWAQYSRTFREPCRPNAGFHGIRNGRNRQKGSRRKSFFGNCNGDMINKYYPKLFSVFGQIQNCYVILDNASTHKRFKNSLEGYNKDQCVDWLTERLADDDTPDHQEDIIHPYTQWYNNHSEMATRKEVMQFIRENKLRVMELVELAGYFGPGLIYLPPYWPELNAAEKLWARLKNDYRKTDPALPWPERLALAYASVDALFARRIISDTIRFARKKHEQLLANAAEVQPHAVAIGEGEGDADDTESPGEESSEECGLFPIFESFLSRNILRKSGLFSRLVHLLPLSRANLWVWMGALLINGVKRGAGYGE